MSHTTLSRLRPNVSVKLPNRAPTTPITASDIAAFLPVGSGNWKKVLLGRMGGI
jgi:hypothetical protein